MVRSKRVDDILKKYEGKVERSLKDEESGYSREYLKFKEEIRPKLGLYEKLAKGIGNTIKLKLSEKDEKRFRRAIDTAHLEITPSDAAMFALAAPLLLTFLFLVMGVGLYFAEIEFPLVVVAVLMGIIAFVYYYANQLPRILAQRWRLQASSQMVPAILYIIIFMKHTSNLERAIKFASDHLQPPLSLDFKKIIWDVETGKYSTIKSSLDDYLEKWKGYSFEFVESFHLIESSLYEPIEARRLEILEKALSVMLDGVYDKMLKFTHNIQSPLTNLYMLGIVLPTLMLALLPLFSTLMGGAISWWHVALFFNLLVPFAVFYYSNNILANRPGGYGETNPIELNPEYSNFMSKKHSYRALAWMSPLFLLGLIPLIFQYTPIPEWLGLQKDYSFSQLGLTVFGDLRFFEFVVQDAGTTGPFGIMALLLSLCIPLAVAGYFYLNYKSRTKNLIDTRNKTKNLEQEFPSALFQLGNRIGDGIPAEIAFGRVSESLRGTPTSGFFMAVNSNIAQFGMSIKKAIFDKRRGAILFYPSDVIRTSMDILIESAKKGLRVAANSLISISEYLKNIEKINRRLKDLLADILSSMKSNMSFLAPLLAGIVVGLSAMITSILVKLQSLLSAGGLETEVMGFGTISTFTQLFDLSKMIPPYYIQLIAGIYVIEIIYILTVTLVSVESGVDPLSEKFEIASNMKKGVVMYLIASLVAILGLSMLATMSLGGL
ncbi:hypothetical protein ACFLZZ_02090 [Nanoarchaeota archaeon]